MSPSFASKVAKSGLLIGLLAVAFGLIPFVRGLYSVKLEEISVSAATINELKAQPNGERISMFALASTDASKKWVEAYTSLAATSKIQSMSAIAGGIAVVVCFGMLLHFIRQTPPD